MLLLWLYTKGSVTCPVSQLERTINTDPEMEIKMVVYWEVKREMGSRSKVLYLHLCIHSSPDTVEPLCRGCLTDRWPGAVSLTENVLFCIPLFMPFWSSFTQPVWCCQLFSRLLTSRTKVFADRSPVAADVSCLCVHPLTPVSLCRGMSAVCVYTIEDIEQIFKTSPFKDADEQTGRPREVCGKQLYLRSKITAASTRHQMIPGINMAAIFQPMWFKFHNTGCNQRVARLTSFSFYW